MGLARLRSVFSYQRVHSPVSLVAHGLLADTDYFGVHRRARGDFARVDALRPGGARGPLVCPDLVVADSGDNGCACSHNRI